MPAPTPPGYTQQEWEDKNPSKPLSALRMAHIEAGISAEEAFTKAVEEYAQQQTEAALASSAMALAPTAVKTAPYEAKPGDYVPCDISGGSVAITLPSAPADKTRVGVKIVAVAGTPGSTSLTLLRSGSDVFNVAGGSTVLTFQAKFQSVTVQYKASTGIWYAQASDTPLGIPEGGGTLDSEGHQVLGQVPSAVQGSSPAVAEITRNAAGQVTGAVTGTSPLAQTLTAIERNSAGQVTSFKQNGVTHTLTRNASGQVTAVS